MTVVSFVDGLAQNFVVRRVHFIYLDTEVSDVFEEKVDALSVDIPILIFVDQQLTKSPMVQGSEFMLFKIEVLKVVLRELFDKLQLN